MELTFCYRLSEGVNCAEFLKGPQNSVQILEDKPLTSNANEGQFVQITPQKVRLKMRPGISTTLTFRGNSSTSINFVSSKFNEIETVSYLHILSMSISFAKNSVKWF